MGASVSQAMRELLPRDGMVHRESLERMWVFPTSEAAAGFLIEIFA